MKRDVANQSNESRHINSNVRADASRRAQIATCKYFDFPIGDSSKSERWNVTAVTKLRPTSLLRTFHHGALLEFYQRWAKSGPRSSWSHFHAADTVPHRVAASRATSRPC